MYERERVYTLNVNVVYSTFLLLYLKVVMFTERNLAIKLYRIYVC